MKHPIQKPVMVGEVLRFTENTVVSLMLELLKNKGIDLNDLHTFGMDYSKEDWDQFNQLIGYSISGAPIDDAICEAAYNVHKNGVSEAEARAEAAEGLLADVRSLTKEGIALLFERHPDDLKG